MLLRKALSVVHAVHIELDVLAQSVVVEVGCDVAQTTLGEATRCRSLGPRDFVPPNVATAKMRYDVDEDVSHLPAPPLAAKELMNLVGCPPRRPSANAKFLRRHGEAEDDGYFNRVLEPTTTTTFTTTINHGRDHNDYTNSPG